MCSQWQCSFYRSKCTQSQWHYEYANFQGCLLSALVHASLERHPHSQISEISSADRKDGSVRSKSFPPSNLNYTAPKSQVCIYKVRSTGLKGESANQNCVGCLNPFCNPVFPAIHHGSTAQLSSSPGIKVSSSRLSVCLPASLSFSLLLECLNKKGY